MRYNVNSRKNKKFYNFAIKKKLCIAKILKGTSFYPN